MAKSYRALTRIKVSGKDDDNGGEYIDRGDKVSAGDVGGKEAFEELIQVGSVVTDAQFNATFPGFDEEAEEGANQPAGTPSNLGEVEGTDLESPEGIEAAEAEQDQ